MRAKPLTIGLLGACASACSPYVHSPPARMVPLEVAKALPTGDLALQGALAGGYVSPDGGLIFSYQGKAVVTFVSGGYFYSLPLAAKEIVFTEADWLSGEDGIESQSLRRIVRELR